MAMRDLVTGAGGCTVPGEASSSSNPLATFASSLLGSLPKTQERVRELPSLPTFQPGQELELDATLPAGAPSLETTFGHEFRDPIADEQRHEKFSELRKMLEDRYDISFNKPRYMDGPPQQALSGTLHSFFNSNRAEAPFSVVALPEMGLSTGDKQRIRDRSSIMARHCFAEQGDEFVDAQVSALLESLNIEGRARDGEMVSQMRELDELWESEVARRPQNEWAAEYSEQYPLRNDWAEEFHAPPNAQNWAEEFQAQQPNNWAEEFQAQQPNNWAEEYHDQHNAQNWGEEFHALQNVEQDWATQFNDQHAPRDMGTLEHTRSLVETLSQNQDPKFQNSKFLHFISKMSRGELILEDNTVTENVPATWANEYEQEHADPAGWAAEFTAGEHSQNWADEFARETPEGWADEYDEQLHRNQFSDDWHESYDRFVEEQLRGERSSSSEFVYVFAAENPYVGHANPIKEGYELFRKGLLSEAVLALEAEVLKNPENSEGWRLLGITHAENDDDRQAIASMTKARDADPTNLEVLLALGVSHTNELEQAEALKYLRGWLQNHPKYGTLVPQEAVERLAHHEVTRLFREAASLAPEDGDVHTVIGVLYNLSHEYTGAIQAFRRALELKPHDYSLWNKLGATQANSARSADAIHAYQQALNLKPNYVRAWSNMGISYANQGMFEESIPYYVRALSMNPHAENAWQYLRMSLSAMDKRELCDACDRRDVDKLVEAFPL